MRAWIFNAALYCDECGRELLAQAKEEGREDYGCSQTYPQGPYSDGGGESDCPQHCDSCGVFLENPLTEDGEEYVRRVFRNDSGTNMRWAADCLPEWKERYAYLLDTEETNA